MKKATLLGLLACIGLAFVACANPATDSATTPAAKKTTKAISAFSFASPAATGVVSESAHTITVSVPWGTSLAALAPTVSHDGSSLSPASGVAQNFTSPVTYTVTAEDASTQAYTVTVTTAACPYAGTWIKTVGSGDPGAKLIVGSDGLTWNYYTLQTDSTPASTLTLTYEGKYLATKYAQFKDPSKFHLLYLDTTGLTLVHYWDTTSYANCYNAAASSHNTQYNKQ